MIWLSDIASLLLLFVTLTLIAMILWLLCT
jgi:hypothetical protein